MDFSSAGGRIGSEGVYFSLEDVERILKTHVPIGLKGKNEFLKNRREKTVEILLFYFVAKRLFAAGYSVTSSKDRLFVRFDER